MFSVKQFVVANKTRTCSCRRRPTAVAIDNALGGVRHQRFRITAAEASYTIIKLAAPYGMTYSIQRVLGIGVACSLKKLE